MSIIDSIFGGESTKGIKFQVADNERRQKFIEEQAALGRRDVLDIIPRGEEALQQGYRAAIDVARRAPITQVQTLRDASQRAQEALIANMGEYRRAIMGLPSTQDPNNFYNNELGMRPVTVGSNTNPTNAFGSSQQPLFLGSQEQDREEMAMRRNSDQFYQLASPNKADELFPEQYRDGVRYNFDSGATSGGVNQADLYNQALAGGGASARPYTYNWSNY